jgi:hypothetical protein
MWSRILPVVCLVLLHSSDGSLLWIESAAIYVLKAGPGWVDHVAKGTGTIVYTATGKTFGVRETEEEVERAVAKSCNRER